MLLCVYIKQMPKNSVTIHAASNTFYIIPWKVYPRPCWRMADNRELTCSQASNEQQPLLQQPQPIKPKRCCHHLRIRKVRSKGAVVVLVWIYFLILSFFNPVYNINTKITLQGLSLHILAISGAIIIFLIGPLAGLVATVYCGRYRVVSWSLWIIWIGNTATVPILILQRLYPAIQDVLVDFGVVLAETVICFGMVMFFVNCVPFGLDQMPDASGEEIKTFIHWFMWTMLAGLASGSLLVLLQCLFLHSPDSTVLMSFSSALPLSIILCIHCVLRKYFIIEPVGINPLTNMSKVLKFAIKNKKPIRRSAFTYCEDEQPSRIDLGKSKYGGPFTNEEVEDVKTFLRMLLVILSLATFVLAPVFIVGYSLNGVLRNEFHITSDLVCPQWIVQTGILSGLSAAFSPVVFDLVILPAVRRCSPSTLKAVGVTQILSIVVSLIMLVTSTIWYIRNTSFQCVLTSINEKSYLPFSHVWIQVPVVTFVLSFAFLVFKGMLEFVCAQAPYRLRGLLIGLLCSALLFGAIVGGGIFTAWTAGYQTQDVGTSNASCGVWFYAFCTAATILGLAVWVSVAKWYKNRERDEPETYRTFIENYYDH